MSATVRLGWVSSLRMVPTPMESAREALTGASRPTWNVSSDSRMGSPARLTKMKVEVALAGIVAVPLAGR